MGPHTVSFSCKACSNLAVFFPLRSGRFVDIDVGLLDGVDGIDMGLACCASVSVCSFVFLVLISSSDSSKALSC